MCMDLLSSSGGKWKNQYVILNIAPQNAQPSETYEIQHLAVKWSNFQDTSNISVPVISGFHYLFGA